MLQITSNDYLSPLPFTECKNNKSEILLDSRAFQVKGDIYLNEPLNFIEQK